MSDPSLLQTGGTSEPPDNATAISARWVGWYPKGQVQLLDNLRKQWSVAWHVRCSPFEYRAQNWIGKIKYRPVPTQDQGADVPRAEISKNGPAMTALPHEIPKHEHLVRLVVLVLRLKRLRGIVPTGTAGQVLRGQGPLGNAKVGNEKSRGAGREGRRTFGPGERPEGLPGAAGRKHVVAGEVTVQDSPGGEVGEPARDVEAQDAQERHRLAGVTFRFEGVQHGP
mmetsp:Transcript_29744/g.83108  ORF Transcript_29744/g.83108 Transcript_29744/m.83108 type:complete len:225 (+) Transcript_29744:60-734(+)